MLLGPPGAGKGTQAKPLAAHRGVAYISSGDLLRGAAAAGSPVGRAAERYMNAGDLVPDELVFALLEEAMPPEGFLLDGFPRTTAQADALDCRLERLGQYAARCRCHRRPDINIMRKQIKTDEVLVDRLAGRQSRRTATTAHEYRITRSGRRTAPLCDIDAIARDRRATTSAATVSATARGLSDEQTAPLVGFYDDRGRLARVDGCGDPWISGDRRPACERDRGDRARHARRRSAARRGQRTGERMTRSRWVGGSSSRALGSESAKSSRVTGSRAMNVSVTVGVVMSMATYAWAVRGQRCPAAETSADACDAATTAGSITQFA